MMRITPESFARARQHKNHTGFNVARAARPCACAVRAFQMPVSPPFPTGISPVRSVVSPADQRIGVPTMSCSQTPPAKPCLCEQCAALCCRYFALPIDNPKSARQYDDIRWYLCHENVVVFIEE